jgi:endonuclease/exonuclease/phosphatase family metal-dependent hydrolase
MTGIGVAWWNVENLFDSESVKRDPQTARTLGAELKGWTKPIRDRKLTQLASIVKLMFDGAGPDLLGLAEVENEDVVNALIDRIDLPARDYRLRDHASPDARGIDVTFVYDAKTLATKDPGHQVILQRHATRDIFWMTVTEISTQASFVVAGNHWPSRSQGQYESEPYRMAVGETLSYVTEHQLAETNLPLLVMGDFNDEPFNRSMQEYLHGTRDKRLAARSAGNVLLNLMWPLMAATPPGTFYFDGWNMLDQFLVSTDFLQEDARIRLATDSARVFNPPVMQGSGGTPKKFGRPSQPTSFDRDGFSDHFPILVTLETSSPA